MVNITFGEYHLYRVHLRNAMALTIKVILHAAYNKLNQYVDYAMKLDC